MKGRRYFEWNSHPVFLRSSFNTKINISYLLPVPRLQRCFIVKLHGIKDFLLHHQERRLCLRGRSATRSLRDFARNPSTWTHSNPVVNHKQRQRQHLKGIKCLWIFYGLNLKEIFLFPAIAFSTPFSFNVTPPRLRGSGKTSQFIYLAKELSLFLENQFLELHHRLIVPNIFICHRTRLNCQRWALSAHLEIFLFDVNLSGVAWANGTSDEVLAVNGSAAHKSSHKARQP